MQASNKKGAKDATTTTTRVAKTGRNGHAGRGKASQPKRQSTAGVSIGSEPVRYNLSGARWPKGEQRTVSSEPSSEEQRAAVYIPGGFEGPSIKALTRLAVIGLLLMGFVIGVIVGRVWL